MGTLIEQPAPTHTIFSIKNTRSYDSQAAGIRANYGIYVRTILCSIESRICCGGEGGDGGGGCTLYSVQ